MKRTQDHPLALSIVNTPLEGEHTPTTSTSFKKFDLWHDLISEMQECVVSFLDNGTKEALSHTYKDAWNKWHISFEGDDDIRCKKIANHLAQDAPLKYIETFIWHGSVDDIYEAALQGRCKRMITYLVRWDRWDDNNEVTRFMLRFLCNMGFVHLHYEALMAVIKYSKHKLFDSLAVDGRTLCISRFPSANGHKVARAFGQCGRYGNIRAFIQLSLDIETMDEDIQHRYANRHRIMMVANLISKPCYAICWADIIESNEFRCVFDPNHPLLASIFSSVLGFDNASDQFHLENVENCYALWKLLGPDLKANIRSIWAPLNASLHLVSSISQLFDNNSRWGKTTCSKGKMLLILDMAKEMGLFFNGFDSDLGFISAVVFLVAEAAVCDATKALCEWLVGNNVYDFGFLGENDADLRRIVYDNFKDAFQSLKKLSRDDDIIPIGLELVELVQQWFATHDFKGCANVREIVDEVCRELDNI